MFSQDHHAEGKRVRVISDDRQTTFIHKGEEMKALQEAGIILKTQGEGWAKVHHKFGIVDDNILINGSFNWTRQALSRMS